MNHYTIEEKERRKTADGYSAICPHCMTRHGAVKTGERWLDLTVCPKCESLQNTLRRARGMRVVGKEIYRGLDHDF